MENGKSDKKIKICKFCKNEYNNRRWTYCSTECFKSFQSLERKNNKERKEYISKYCSKWRKSNNNYHRQWKSENPNYMKEWWINHQGYLREWYENNDFVNTYKERLEVQRLACKSIKIPEGYRCEVCQEKLAVHRHHEDYSKPLQVILCCRKCHGILDEKRHIKEQEVLKHEI